MADTQKSFLTYKGKPLVRKGNTIYYGNMSDPFVIMLSVASTHEVHGVKIADKVIVQLLNTDPNAAPTELVIKKTDTRGLYNAIDIAAVWLEAALENN